jgi:hypothetical protein
MSSKLDDIKNQKLPCLHMLLSSFSYLWGGEIFPSCMERRHNKCLFTTWEKSVSFQKLQGYLPDLEADV